MNSYTDKYGNFFRSVTAVLRHYNIPKPNFDAVKATGKDIKTTLDTLIDKVETDSLEKIERKRERARKELDGNLFKDLIKKGITQEQIFERYQELVKTSDDLKRLNEDYTFAISYLDFL